MSFNSDKLVAGDEYDYVTRTSFNQGVLQTTGFVNAENINNAGIWSLGLLQMDFFFRRKPWYAGQFVRKIIPTINIPIGTVLFFSTILNLQKKVLLSVLVRDVDVTFRNIKVYLPITTTGKINFDFMESFIRELEEERIRELSAYLTVSGLDNCELSKEEEKILSDIKQKEWKFFRWDKIFDHIKQGRRLKKEDQKPGDIPFVMAGVSNTGVVNYVSNPVAKFPANSITVDIFGNTFYRSFLFGAGDDTGVYWNATQDYTKAQMLFFAATMGKELKGKFSFGKKLRSSQSFDFKISLPVTSDGTPDYTTMETFMRTVQKLVVRDVADYTAQRIVATTEITRKTLH